MLNAVLTGRYASQDDVIREALSRLREEMPRETEMAPQNAGVILTTCSGW